MRTLITIGVILLPLYSISQNLRSEEKHRNPKKHIKLLEQWNATDTIDEWDKYFNLITIGNRYNKLEEYDMAYYHYILASILIPDLDVAYYNMGRIEFFEYKEDSIAVESFTKSIQNSYLNPDLGTMSEIVDTGYFCDYLSLRALAYTILGEYEKEIKDYKTKNAFCGLDEDDLFNRGFTYNERIGDYEAAIADFSKVLELNKDAIGVYYNRAWAYYRNDESAKGLKDINDFIKVKKKEDSGAWYTKGLILKDMKRVDDAIESFDKALDIEQDELIFYERGLCYVMKEDFETALADFKQANELNDEESEYISWMATCFAVLEEHEKACELWFKAAGMGDEDAQDDLFTFCSEE